MTRLFYISLLVLLLVSCSGNTPIRYIKLVEDEPCYPFIIEYGAMPHDSFPMHYVTVKDSIDKSKRYSYSFIKNYGDSIVWEEGIIREE